MDRLDVPWLPYLAVEFLGRQIRPSWQAFEWGSGGSTRWLAARCQRVISIEHDPSFLILDLPANVEQRYVLRERGELGPDPSEPANYRSGSTELGPGLNWRNYARAIDDYGQFDLVLVDGMARASCIAHAVPHVRPGGWLVVDNTGDRPWYLARTAHLLGNWDGGWERVTFFGHGPQLLYLWECSMWRRPLP